MLRIPPPEDDGFALALIKMEGERPVGILGEETAKQHLPRAELRDGKRPSVLAFKNLAVLAALPRSSGF